LSDGRVEVRGRLDGARCPYCHAAIERAEDDWACPVCKARHHQECFFENGGCTLQGCPGTTPLQGGPSDPKKVQEVAENIARIQKRALESPFVERRPETDPVKGYSCLIAALAVPFAALVAYVGPSLGLSADAIHVLLVADGVLFVASGLIATKDVPDSESD
jgi:hypothetical protein